MNTLNKNTELLKNEASSITQLHHSRNKTKAEVYSVNHNGSRMVCKDYSKRNILIRLFYGRYSLYREDRAYARLEGVSGVPRCFGLEGKDVLLLEHINGKPLSRFKRGSIPESVFIKLKKIILCMHDRGVANGDLHRSNVLLTADWDVYLIDYASAFFTDNADRPGVLFRGIKDLDMYAFERIKARYLCLEKPVPKGIFGVCYVLCVTIKKSIKKIKKCFKANKK